MQKKTFISAVFFALATLICCHNYKRDPGMFTESYAKKSRAEKIQECAKCHPREYEMEQLGPHASAFRQVHDYVFHRAQTSPHFPAVYSKWVMEKFNTVCARCHTGENLYENSLKASLLSGNLDSILQNHGNEISQIALARKDSTGWRTGIDCLTCHAANENVITNLFSKADPMAACRPVRNALFSTDQNCISCHFSVVTGMADNIHNPEMTKSQSCVSCHFEYDENNKTTHYMYWRHDPPQKKREAVRAGIFDDFTVAVKKEDGRKATLTIEWANKRAPHRITETEDFIVIVTLNDSREKLILSDTVRVNDKGKADKDIKEPIFKGGEVPGSPVGYTFLPTDTAFRRNVTFTMPANSKPLTISITGYIKSQYWIDDAEAEKVYERKQVF